MYVLIYIYIYINMYQLPVIAWYKYNMDNVFRVQRFSVELFSEPSDEENKSRKSLNEENMSKLYEEPCYNLFIVNISFFIWKSSYNVIGNEKSLLIRRIRGIYDTSFMFSIMVLVLNRILAIVKINTAVMKVIIRRFRRSPFLVVKIEGWILHSFIIWQMTHGFEWLR